MEHNSLGATHEVGENWSNAHVHIDAGSIDNLDSPVVLPPNAMGVSARSGLVKTDKLKDSIHMNSSEHREKRPRSMEPLYSGGGGNFMKLNSASAIKVVKDKFPDSDES